MRTLFIYPEFPKTFWSYEKILELVNRKVLLPPLGMVTVAALLPQQWEMKLVDRNVREVTEAEWNWAELVIISGMIVQKDDMAVQIANAKERGLPVAVGGPFASSTPDAPELDLADFKVLDEGEITLPMFIEAIERGERSGRFSAKATSPCDRNSNSPLRSAAARGLRLDGAVPRLPVQLRVLRHHRSLRPQTPHQNPRSTRC